MLKHDIKLLQTIYENFKHLLPVKYSTLRLGYVWLEELNICAKYAILLNSCICFIG